MVRVIDRRQERAEEEAREEAATAAAQQAAPAQPTTVDIVAPTCDCGGAMRQCGLFWGDARIEWLCLAQGCGKKKSTTIENAAAWMAKLQARPGRHTATCTALPCEGACSAAFKETYATAGVMQLRLIEWACPDCKEVVRLGEHTHAQEVAALSEPTGHLEYKCRCGLDVYVLLNRVGPASQIPRGPLPGVPRNRHEARALRSIKRQH